MFALYRNNSRFEFAIGFYFFSYPIIPFLWYSQPLVINDETHYNEKHNFADFNFLFLSNLHFLSFLEPDFIVANSSLPLVEVLFLIKCMCNEYKNPFAFYSIMYISSKCNIPLTRMKYLYFFSSYLSKMHLLLFGIFTFIISICPYFIFADYYFIRCLFILIARLNYCFRFFNRQ